MIITFIVIVIWLCINQYLATRPVTEVGEKWRGFLKTYYKDFSIIELNKVSILFSDIREGFTVLYVHLKDREITILNIGLVIDGK